MPYLDKMVKIKIEDLVFWLLIIVVISILVWKLFGSPTDTATLITTVLFLISIILTLWKRIYYTERKTEVGFMKVKGDLKLIKNDIGYIKRDINNINDKLKNIQSLIERK